MSFSQSKNQETKSLILAKIALFLASLFIYVVFSKINSYALVAILAITVFSYFFLKGKYYWLVILAMPSMTLGQVLSLEIRPGWNYEMSLAEGLLMLGTVLILLEKLLEKKMGELKVDKLSFFLFVYLLISLLSVNQALSMSYFFFGLKAVTFSFLAYFLAENLLDNNKKIRYFLNSLAATLAILSLQVYYKFYQMGFSGKFFTDRKHVELMIGPLATTAAILIILIPIVLAYFFYNQKQHRSEANYLLLAVFLAGTLAVFITLGKAAIISLLIGLVYMFMRLKEKRVIFVLSAGLFISLSLIFLSPIATGLVERVKNTLNDANTEYRILEYKTSKKIVSNNIWFGVGSGQQLVYFKKMLNYDKSDLINNFFVQALVDFGLVGISALLLIIVSLIAKIKQLKRRASASVMVLIFGFVASIIASFFNGLAEVTYFALPYAIIFWLSLGAFANLDTYEKSFNHSN